MWFDTHCHLDDPVFTPRLAEVVAEAAGAGVTGMVVPGIAPEGWDRIIELARTFPGVFPACGIHPMHAGRCNAVSLGRLAELAPHCLAIGEIGLDYLLDVPRDLQIESFRAQLRIALTAARPVLIHCRKAFADVLTVLKEERAGEVGGVFHSFSGSVETAREVLKLGFYVSISGSITFSNAVRPVAVAAALPADRLLLETDAPDLTPEPHRGATNLPSYLLYVAQRVAETRGTTVEDLARQTTENALRLFHLAPLPA
ncbi:TatD family hydrolase [Geomesophilobacter sediminis]|uniref:TatD family hydrolase n=1 Tax=Geomesophilobacter sediminis TaxID=2798584 RepID=A0A8J7IS61_9BACT|nr:TatD family hydrolase [Geomesophilobacter sediminis]MBJ6726034.1 TatD family hydrolase [Geomesophilobacter sediminis]